jgi:hypothetical protein
MTDSFPFLGRLTLRGRRSFKELEIFPAKPVGGQHPENWARVLRPGPVELLSSFLSVKLKNTLIFFESNQTFFGDPLNKASKNLI